MPGLDRKRRGELLRSVFDVLADHQDGLRARDVLKEVEQRLGPTPFEEETYEGSDTRRFEKSIRFVTINAVKAGWMIKDAGIWTPTESGLVARLKITDPEEFVLEAQRLYKQWADEQPPKDEADEAEVEQEIADSSGLWSRPKRLPGKRFGTRSMALTHMTFRSWLRGCSAGWATSSSGSPVQGKTAASTSWP
jgi:restriction system protein